jgi:hypothetical protein
MMTRFMSSTAFLALVLAGVPGSAAPQDGRPAPSEGRERAVSVERASSNVAPARYEAPVHRAEPQGGVASSGYSAGASRGGPDTGGRADAWADRAPGFNRGLAWADQGHRAVPRGSSGGTSSGGSRVSSGSNRSAPSSSGSSVRSGSSSARSRGSSGTYNGSAERRTSGGSAGAYARSRDGRPVTGTAVPRPPYGGGGYYPPYYPGWGGGYWGWGYPGFWYPGWGYYGWWPYWGFGWGWGFDYGYTSGPVYADDFSDQLGSVRLKVKPRDAAVHVDGYYVGIVDEFDGAFQRLRVEVGPHVITVKKPGFAPLEYKVRVVYDHTLTLEGEMLPEGVSQTTH